jgi:hypothetical protein
MFWVWRELLEVGDCGFEFADVGGFGFGEQRTVR